MPGPLIILAYPKIDHEKDYVYFWTPFSLLMLGKALLDTGFEVIIFDGNQASIDDWERLLSAHIERAIAIGISIMTGGGQIGHALELAVRAKGRPCCPPIVYGGPHVNVLPGETLKHPLVDAILQGPGQNSIAPFARALQGDPELLLQVPGLRMRRGGMVSGQKNTPRAEQLGRYPWELLDVERYVRDDPGIAPRTLNYVSSQGCVYKCRFCYELTYEGKYSAMPAGRLLDDVQDLHGRFHLSGLKFYDADWFINLRRSAEFADGLIERGIRISWAASINPNDVLKARKHQPNLMKLLADSGCSRLLMGVESGSDRVLSEIVEKDISTDGILDVAQEIASYGIRGSYTFIVGFPGESEAEEAATYRFIDRLRRLTPTPETRVHVFAPYPGTPLYERAIQHGFCPPDDLEGWSNYDYYRSQTPWTNDATVSRAKAHTQMVLHPANTR